MIIADLHMHGKYSRATSPKLDIPNLEKWGNVKGLDLIATGDFQHPLWNTHLKEHLVEDDTGILKTSSGAKFILQSEISLMYTQGFKGRRVHHTMLAPSFEVVDQIIESFLKKGRIDYDGRPIFGFDSIEFVEMMRSISHDIEIIPAHCLVPDSFIHTSEGMKEIKDIDKKDLVLTHKGTYKSVEKIYKRRYSGEVIKIVPTCMKMGNYFTPEHPIYSIKSYKKCKNVSHTICKPTCAYLKRGCKKKEFENYTVGWNQIKDLEKGDLILYPRYNKIKDKKFIYLSDFVKNCFKDGEYVKPRKEKIYIKNLPVKNKIEVSEDFCRLIGYYLAEGYTVKDKVCFTFSGDEQDYLLDVKSLISKIFGDFVNVQIQKERNSSAFSVVVYSKLLKEFFEMFYSKKPYKSFNKCLPGWFIGLPLDKLENLLLGWWRGDVGCTSSVDLCNQFKLIFIKMGIIPSISVITSDSINSRRIKKPNLIKGRKIISTKDHHVFTHLSFFRDSYSLDKLVEFKKYSSKLGRRKGWIDKNYIYLPILRIDKKKYSGLVYNLEVKEDNSYLTENLAVHNCWTPWFGLLGSKSGFNSVESCFKEKSKHIHAIETGLSSDPEMNWRVSSLDKYNLISSSDSHSFWPWRIGREATIFDCSLTYSDILNSIRTGEGLKETIEVDPGYGIYHFDGHRKCKICFSPAESKEHHNLCPKCGKNLTIGVANRVEELADRPEGYKPENAPGFRRMIPLAELLSGFLGIKQLYSKTIFGKYMGLIEKFGSEFDILMNTPREELLNTLDGKFVDIIMLNRKGGIKVKPGYDGVYGVPILEASPQKKLGDF